MELKNSRYGNKMDLYLKDLIQAMKDCKDVDTAFLLQNKIRDMLLWRLEECEEAVKYNGKRTKSFFE